MNILYLTDDEISSGGAVKEHINAICKGFKKRGHKVTLICPLIHTNVTLPVDEVITYGMGKSISRVFGMIKSVHRLLNEEKFDAIYIRYRASQLPLFFLSSFTKLSRFLEINGIAEKEMRVGRVKYALIRLVQKILEKKFFQKSSGIFSVTKEIAYFYENNYKIRKQNLFVFNNGVWPERFEPNFTLRKTETIKLGFVGNISWWQGLETVIKAVSDVNYRNNVHLTIVGDGNELNKLKSIVANNKAVNIEFLGQLSSSQIPKIMKEFDIGVVSKSIRGEGLSPIKLYEYWAAGLPVIATNLPGLDIVSHIKGGLNYEMDDVQSFKKTLKTIISNRNEWRTYRENGRRYVEENANWHKIGQSTVEIIENKNVNNF